ncbi:predicted protein [Histoplasma capsulatum G186AR]|uniref:Uncharacterized protein n=1 Tax=Ajellomyces capsulatus (strain G186AR / H82 / ATCC MYA-2454 / RMSCC 2432) TaxID=447093 RepID=C0NC63_AJECG|nr:uncharacterized protein HCBG_00709 [Histoplasma capsulatum G186AR]EEH11254.1 predicted protein [Histoplasma capsulatum G186AR]
MAIEFYTGPIPRGPHTPDILAAATSDQIDDNKLLGVWIALRHVEASHAIARRPSSAIYRVPENDVSLKGCVKASAGRVAGSSTVPSRSRRDIDREGKGVLHGVKYKMQRTGWHGWVRAWGMHGSRKKAFLIVIMKLVFFMIEIFTVMMQQIIAKSNY